MWGAGGHHQVIKVIDKSLNNNLFGQTGEKQIVLSQNKGERVCQLFWGRQEDEDGEIGGLASTVLLFHFACTKTLVEHVVCLKRFY